MYVLGCVCNVLNKRILSHETSRDLIYFAKMGGRCFNFFLNDRSFL